MYRQNQASVEKPQLQLNPKLQRVTDNLVHDYTLKSRQPGPYSVHDLNPDEITYLQAYLEQVKIQQINKQAVPTNVKKCSSIGDGKPITQCRVPTGNRMTDLYNPHSEENPIPGNRGGMATRSRKSINSDKEQFKPNMDSNAYYNPYEVGARQNEFGSLYKPTYTGPYNVKPDLLADIGLDNRMYWEKFPGDVRNVNVESLLYQGEMTHIPGQREVTEKEINRFELLPFDPQDTRHIVWKDNMPRGGYPTRVDRLETL